MSGLFTSAKAPQTMAALPPDMQLQQQQLLRQQAIADALRKQSLEPMGDTQVINGWAVKKSPMEGLSKLAQAVSAGYVQNKTNERQMALATKLREQGVTDMNGVMGALQGSEAKPAAFTPDTFDSADKAATFPEAQYNDTAAVAPDKQKAMALALQSQNPMVQGIGSKLLEQSMKGSEGVNINGQMVDKFSGKVMGTMIPKQDEAFTLGDTRYGADGKPKAQYNDPNKPFNADGTPNAGYQKFEISKHKAGATSVSVKTDVKTGESLAAQVGPMMKDSTSIAEGAVKQVDAANRVIRAMDAGNAITGPGATLRLKGAQISQMLGVGGKDEAEKIANTRETIRGFAELTLQGRQQMRGQGAITESEGVLAEKAMSGKVDDLTAPEIKQLAAASKRSAKFNYAEHTRKLKVMQSNPSLQGIAPFYEGPAMPEDADQNQSHTIHSQADAILRGGK